MAKQMRGKIDGQDEVKTSSAEGFDYPKTFFLATTFHFVSFYIELAARSQGRILCNPSSIGRCLYSHSDSHPVSICSAAAALVQGPMQHSSLLGFA